jgi:16S rRNA (guanine966-N2)-methyltransferase
MHNTLMAQHKSGAPNRVRIIGGNWKKSVISFPAIEGVRPTPDRVRETVMNWLGQDLSGWQVLDCFAGTGAFALECASRGAARVVALDTQALAVKSISEHAARLGGKDIVTALRVDAMNYLATCGAQFDLVLCDPPFSGRYYEKLAEIAPQVLKPHGVLYVEAPQEFTEFGPLVRSKHARAGAVHYHLFHP